MDERIKQFLMQKYPDMQGDLAKEKLASLESMREAVTPGGGTIAINALKSLIGKKSYSDYANESQAKADAMIDRERKSFDERIAEGDNQFKRAKNTFDVAGDITTRERDDDVFKRESDPNSMESQVARSLAQKMGAKTGVKIPDTLTAAQLKGSSKALAEMYNMEMRAQQDRQQAMDSAAARRERMDEMALRREEMKAMRDKDRVDKQVEKLSKDVEGAQGSLGAIDKIEETLGAPLEDFDTSGNELKVAGKKKDLPGTNIPGLGRYSFYSADARKLRDRASSVFNAVLKDRSGAAVTTPELMRLKEEFSQGKFNTEKELIEALKLYKTETQKALVNRQAGYDPSAVNEYEERGGRVFRPSKASSASGLTLEQKRKRLEEINSKLAGD